MNTFDKFYVIEKNEFDKYLESNKNYLFAKKFAFENVNMLFVYNNVNIQINDENKFFRNVIYIEEGDKYRLISYSYNSIDYITVNDNTEILTYDKYEISEGIEGTQVSVFNINNKWFFATRKKLDMFESYFGTTMSHGNMFLRALGETTLENFEKLLDKNYNYYFVIVDYNNRNLVDYSKEFGMNYSKLFMTSIRRQSDLVEVLSDDLLKLTCEFKKYPNIAYISPLSKDKLDINNLIKTNENKLFEYESYIVKEYHGNMTKLTKLVSSKYVNLKNLKGNYGTPLEIYVNCFQKDQLDHYLNSVNNKKNIGNVIKTVQNYFNVIAEYLLKQYENYDNIKLKNTKYIIDRFRFLIGKEKIKTIDLKNIKKQLKYFIKVKLIMSLLCEIIAHDDLQDTEVFHEMTNNIYIPKIEKIKSIIKPNVVNQ